MQAFFLLGALLGAYLMGSIPSGLLITKLFHKGDIRQIGSKNIGATNVLRTGSKTAAALTLLCDALKGFIPVTLFSCLAGSDIRGTVFVALAAVLGHVFPFELHFKGGKGVATALGTLFAISPLSAGIALAVWIGVFAWKRISSLAALSACVSLPFLLGFMTLFSPSLTTAWTYSLVLAPLLLFTHRENIVRLLKHEETSFRKGEPQQAQKRN